MKILLSAVLLIGSFSAFSAINIEPFIGTTLTGSFENNDCESDCSDDISGTFYGARASYGMMGFFGGVDVRMGTYEFDDFAIGEIEEEGRIALLLGYELPVLLRFWFTYALSNSLNASIGGTDAEYSGTDYSVGVGYNVLPMLSVNLEYTMLNLEEVDIEGNSSPNDLDSDINTLLLSVSVPLSI